VIFVSGGSESINYAIKGAAVAQQLQLRGNHIVTSQAEHTCVLETVRFLEANGFRATYLPVDEHGRVSPQELAAAITDKTVVVSIMHANNEIGTLQPIRELVAAAKAANPNVLFHTDAAQSVAKVRVDVREMGVDYLTVAGHKLYAPKGVGALFIRKGTPPLQKMVHGACHEFNLRAGTENVASIVGFGTACELGSSRLEENFKHLQRLRDRLLAELRAGLGREAEALLRVNGHPELRLPNTLSVSFKNIRGSELQRALRHRVACSGGAACNDGKESKSHVLRAIRLADAYAFGTLRLSVGLPTTEADVIEAARALAAEVLRLHARNEKAAAESGLLFPLSPSSSSTSSGAASAQSPLSAPAPPPPPRKGDAEAAH
jgi:cysteine sulfinate desulfinase/cysteine desulfurase-like protein